MENVLEAGVYLIAGLVEEFKKTYRERKVVGAWSERKFEEEIQGGIIYGGYSGILPMQEFENILLDAGRTAYWYVAHWKYELSSKFGRVTKIFRRISRLNWKQESAVEGTKSWVKQTGDKSSN